MSHHRLWTMVRWIRYHVAYQQILNHKLNVAQTLMHDGATPEWVHGHAATWKRGCRSHAWAKIKTPRHEGLRGKGSCFVRGAPVGTRLVSR